MRRGGLPRVLLLGDPKKGKVRRLLDGFLPWIEERSEVVGVCLDHEEDLSQYDADLLFAFGGDGTILSAARRLKRHQIPTLGINMGKLGFLAEATQESLRPVLEKALSGQLPEEQRLMLECWPPGASEAVLVLNDVVIHRSNHSSLVEVSVRIDDRYVTTYVGDGLIVATPVGSTAYSLAAGGPILSPEVDALVLSPIAPHALPVRPLVVPSSGRVTLEVEGRLGKEVGELSLDGQVGYKARGGDRIVLDISPVRFRLLTLEAEDFYKILRRKFGWAGSPRYARKKR
ncbi:MAG TPA: NAD(+)/NADH kinase [Planctomycetes bacterium]|nr:NAD(+)/NADH kinase [Planctomycetota bacterium]